MAVELNMKLYSVEYLGFTAMDKRFSRPMLPWIIAEIKRRGTSEKVRPSLYFIISCYEQSRVSQRWCSGLVLKGHSFSRLACERSIAFSKVGSPQSAILGFLFQFSVCSGFFKVIQ